jgi:glycerol-3-phosphate dehydrogenase
MSTDILDYRQKSIKKLKTEKFDLLVIGAGITGAGIAWDAALRGLKVAIIDKIDFGTGTSSGSSKLVHAGIRYLAYGEFKLVHQASVERQWMFKSFRHQTTPIPFLIPIYKKGKNSFLKMMFAGAAYDISARFKNTENHSFLNKEKTLQLFPGLNEEILKRSLFYWDGVMDDARVTLETILTAQEKGALTLNYIKAKGFLLEEHPDLGEITKGINAEDVLTGDQFEIKAKVVVNATGPWTDEILSNLPDSKKLLRTTKGVHIITKRLYRKNIVLVVVADDNRSMFVIPFRKHYSLIGTTDTDYKGDLDNVAVTQEDIDYIIEAVNNDLPGTISRRDVLSAYSGIRPLIISPKAKSETDTSRDFKIFETKPNLLTVTGGKYTIFRLMAEKTINKVLNLLQLNKNDYPCTTKEQQLHGSEGIENMLSYLKKHVPLLIEKYELPFDIVDHIVHTYGTAHIEIFKLIDRKPELKQRIGEDRPHILAEIVYAVKNEMCLTISDFLLRRTQLQLIENQALDCVDKVADVMSKLLGWDNKTKSKQIEEYKQNLVWKN